MTTLRARMIEDLQIRNYSPRTISTYVWCVAKYAQFFGQSPEALGPQDIHAYQKWLVDKKRASWSAFNQSVCALRFLYTITLDQKIEVKHIPFAKQDKKLPDILSTEEIRLFFEAVRNLKHRTVLMTLYGAGLRLSEALGLRVSDVDGTREQIHVRHGKGGKDRYAILPPTLLHLLREYWRVYKPDPWLFPGRPADHPMTPSVIQRVVPIALKRAGISKHVTTHTMRHCFATHLLESGTDLKTIQHRLGHRFLSTTSMYLHVAKAGKGALSRSSDLLSAIKVRPAGS